MLGFILGIFVGGMLGFIGAAMFAMAGRADLWDEFNNKDTKGDDR